MTEALRGVTREQIIGDADLLDAQIARGFHVTRRDAEAFARAAAILRGLVALYDSAMAEDYNNWQASKYGDLNTAASVSLGNTPWAALDEFARGASDGN